jgi:ComF family protein
MPDRRHADAVATELSGRERGGTVRLRDLVLDALFPMECLVCTRPLRGAATHDGPLCAGCRDATPIPPAPLCERCGVPLAPAAPTTTALHCAACVHAPPAFTRARGAGLYEPGPAPSPLVAAVHALKYRGVRPVARSLAVLIAGRLALPPGALLVPVPLHPARLRERRFNQAVLIARELGRLTRLSIAPRALARRLPTSPQTQLARHARRRNLTDAFVALQPQAIAGRRVVLIDDVVTTGATADACARVLLAAGASDVLVCAAGRTPSAPRP